MKATQLYRVTYVTHKDFSRLILGAGYVFLIQEMTAKIKTKFL